MILFSGVLKQTVKEFLSAFSVVTALALFDAIIGAGISAGLWPTFSDQQAVLDFWQLALALVSFSTLYWVGSKSLDIGVAVGLMLTSYVEDTLYYALLPVTQPIVSWLSHGALKVPLGFPDSIGGWLGWVTRFFQITPPLSFKLWIVFLLNSLSLITVWVLLWQENKKAGE